MDKKIVSVHRVTSALALAISTFLVAQSARAQAIADDAATEDIIVTAQGRAESLQKVPVAVSVVSGETLVTNNIRNMEQLSQRLPSVRIQTAPSADVLNIRGVGSSLNPGFEQSVATFVDGAYRGRSRSSRAAFFDVERVEVLKGPQTTFFGNNAIAGAFNITTRKPGNEFAVNAIAFYAAEADEYSLDLGADLPVTDSLAFRLAGKIYGMEGYIKNADKGDDGPHSEDKMGRLSMVWEVNDKIRTEARVDLIRLRARGHTNLVLQRCPPDEPFAPRGACKAYLDAGGENNDRSNYVSDVGPGRLRLNTTELNQVTTIDLAFSDLVLNTAYYKHVYNNFVNIHPFPFDATSPFANVPSSPIKSSQTPTRFQEDFRQFSQEVRLQSTGERALNYTIGAYYSNVKMKNHSNHGYYFSNFAALIPTLVPNFTPIDGLILNTERSRTLSVFSALTWNINERLRITPSARYTNVKKRAFRDAQIGTNGDDIRHTEFVPIPGANAILGPLIGVEIGNYDNPRRTFEDFLPSLGVEYDAFDDVMLYGTYSKGFKAGGFAQYTSRSEFESETVDSFEVGVKSQLFDRRLRLNISAFHMEYKNLQEATTVTLAGGGVRNIVGNVAVSKVKGVELSANLRAATGLEIYSELGYLDAKYTRYPGAPCTIAQGLTQLAPCTQDLAGSVRAFSPKWSGSVGFTYSREILDNLELRMNGNVFFTSGFYVNASIDPYLYQSAFQKIDARIAVGPSSKQWELAVVGRNLADKFTASYRAPIAGGPGTTQFLSDPRRSVGLQLSVQY